jgi:hypothetical protein
MEHYIVEWSQLKSFALGAFIMHFIWCVYVRWTYHVKVFEIDRVIEIKKP